MLKYRNKPTTVDGHRFASKAEARRYSELRLRERAMEISDLRLQPEFYLTVNGIEVCKYVGDFSYWDHGKYVVEDVKGVKTAVYRLKKKLMLACLAIAITEVPVKGGKWPRTKSRRKRSRS